MTDLIAEARDLHKVFDTPRGKVAAVERISFTIPTGASIGLVGESGSGKTTTARMVVGLTTPTAGLVRVDGRDPRATDRRTLSGIVQMVFQDPYLSLSPRMAVGTAVGYPLQLRGVDGDERARSVREVFDMVGLPFATAKRYPHQLSTGQRQRIGIARALITRPQLIVADEPLSSVDVSLQSQILNLFSDIQRETQVAYLVVSHDLGLVGQLCDYVIVMREGKVVEEGPATKLLHGAEDPYTARLLAAAGLDAIA